MATKEKRPQKSSKTPAKKRTTAKPVEAKVKAKEPEIVEVNVGSGVQAGDCRRYAGPVGETHNSDNMGVSYELGENITVNLDGSVLVHSTEGNVSRFMCIVGSMLQLSQPHAVVCARLSSLSYLINERIPYPAQAFDLENDTEDTDYGNAVSNDLLQLALIVDKDPNAVSYLSLVNVNKRLMMSICDSFKEAGELMENEKVCETVESPIASRLSAHHAFLSEFRLYLNAAHSTLGQLINVMDSIGMYTIRDVTLDIFETITEREAEITSNEFPVTKVLHNIEQINTAIFHVLHEVEAFFQESDL